MMDSRLFLSTLAALCVVIDSVSGQLEAAGIQRSSSDARLFAGVYSTVTRTSLITSTTATDFYTCYSTFSTTFACGGRRKRRGISRQDLPALETPDLSLPTPAAALHSSLGEPRVAHSSDKDKLLLTLITTSTTTFTFSTSTVNSSTTVSIIYYCSTANMSTVPSCG